MKSVERLGIKRNLFDDCAARGKEKTIHRVNSADGASRRAKDTHNESLLRMTLRNLAENVWRSGGDPFTADQAIRACHANEIVLAQMFLKSSGKVMIENLDVVVTED